MALLKVGVRAETWQEALTAAGDLLVAAGHVRPDYVSAMIKVVEDLGPYIVLVEGFALAHAAPGSEVLENAISFAVLEKQVDFGSGKFVQGVFALAAKDHDSHIEALGKLAELLADEQTRNLLLNTADPEQLRELLSGVLGE